MARSAQQSQATRGAQLKATAAGCPPLPAPLEPAAVPRRLAVAAAAPPLLEVVPGPEGCVDGDVGGQARNHAVRHCTRQVVGGWVGGPMGGWLTFLTTWLQACWPATVGPTGLTPHHP